ncbi:hypothetical protein B0H13DRAFT_1850825 [Mycena leptocephala]|nr:hypothetical protein B0H13DRAFT_1850825 [Mycena leptocephala]
MGCRGIFKNTIAGDLNEWEVVIFYKDVQRAITLARAYVNRANTDFFEFLFDTFREIKIETTGKDLQFARFVQREPPRHERGYGGRTGARPVNGFKKLVSPEQFRRLKDFMHNDSVEALRSFTQFVEGLEHQEIRNWWAHKEMRDWIIPCLVKSQSNILPEHWESDRTPATTNTGEAQHHWTNSLTGIGLSLVKALERQVASG